MFGHTIVQDLLDKAEEQSDIRGGQKEDLKEGKKDGKNKGIASHADIEDRALLAAALKGAFARSTSHVSIPDSSDAL